jgi:hypothetical protein
MNFLRKKQSEAKGKGTPQQRGREMTPEEHAKLIAEMQLLFTIKLMDSAFSKICMNRCLNYDDERLEDSEKNCLQNCENKLEKFLAITSRTQANH